jgi:HEAT repeat protein
MMGDDHPQPADPLNDLLAQAHWPDSPAALKRLEQTWDSISPARRAHRRNLWRVAAAAAVLLATSAAMLIMMKRSHVGQRVPLVLVQPRPRSVEGTGPEALPGKAPTPLQRLAIEQELARPPRLPLHRAAATIDQAIAQLSADPAVDPEPLCAKLKGAIAPDLLLVQLRQRVTNLQGAQRAAAIRLIGISGNEQAVAVLQPLLSESDARQEALDAICQLASLPTLERLLASAQDDSERRKMIAAMLRRDPTEAMPAYLRFVENRRTRSVALEALDDLAQPPVPELMGALRSPQISVRLAAARALGRIDGPRTTAELVALISSNVSRREALAALLYSKGDEAKAAVAGASQSRELGAVVYSVQTQLQQLN